MELIIVNEGTEKFPFYRIMDGKTEVCACDSLKKAEIIIKLFAMHDVSFGLFYVVAHSQHEEGSWEQISNGFEDYDKAVNYRNGNFCNNNWPNAFIVASINEIK